MIKTISDQVQEYIEKALASGATYDELAGTLFVRPDGVVLKLKRAKNVRARANNKFDGVISFGDKVVVLPLPEQIPEQEAKPHKHRDG